MISPPWLWAILAASIFSMGIGIWGAYRWRKPWDGAGALWALLGLAGGVIATLLLHVPSFFRSP